MWNLASSNRILDLKWKQQAQQKHKAALRTMRSTLNTSTPRRYSFLDSKPKRRQQELGKINQYLEKQMKIES